MATIVIGNNTSSNDTMCVETKTNNIVNTNTMPYPNKTENITSITGTTTDPKTKI